jgi:hypothetical protein
MVLGVLSEPGLVQGHMGLYFGNKHKLPFLRLPENQWSSKMFDSLNEGLLPCFFLSWQWLLQEGLGAWEHKDCFIGN